MAGTVKKLLLSEGTSVTPSPSSFSGIGVYSTYANDAAYVTAKGSAATTGDVYYNSTSNLVRVYKTSAWVNEVSEANNENVGIKMTSPSSALTVVSNTSTGLGVPVVAIRQTSGTSTPAGVVETTVGSYTGTTFIVANTLSAASTYNLLRCMSDSDGDAGGPNVEFEVRGDGYVGIGESVNTAAYLNIRPPTDVPQVFLHAWNSADGYLLHGSSDGNFYLNHKSTGNLGIKMTAGGEISMPNLQDDAGSYPVKWTSGTGLLTHDTSSARYKKNIRDSKYGIESVRKLISRMFEYRKSGKTDIGLVAEEVAKVIPELVVFDDKGRPDAVHYDRFVSVLTRSIQDLDEQVQSQGKKIDSLNKKVDSLEERLALLEAKLS